MSRSTSVQREQLAPIVANDREAPAMPPVPRRGRIKLPPEPDFAEGVFQRALIDAASATPGLRCWRQQTGKVRVRGGFMQLSPNGAGDIVGTAAPDGLHWEAEVKGWKTAVQPEQDPWGIATEAAGAVYVRCRPRRGESLGEAVARCLGELLEAIGECRSRRACSAAEVAIAGDLSEAGEVGAEVNLEGSEALLRALADATGGKRRVG